MRIAIIHYQQPLQIHTAYLARYLAEKGHDAHLFLFAENGMADYAEVQRHKKITIHKKHQIGRTFRLLFFRVLRKILRKLSGNNAVWEDLGQRLFFRQGLKRARAYLAEQGTAFDFSIGIEKSGLACAYFFMNDCGTPYYYYSLELYLDDHPISRSITYNELRKLEIKAHRRSLGTIVQDAGRRDALYAANTLETHKNPAYFLPVSLTDRPAKPQKEHGRTLFLFGMNRMDEDEFVALAKSLPPDYIFFMHHFFIEPERDIIRRHELRNVVLSSDFLPDAAIDRLLAKARIGLCWYSVDTANERLVAFSSEKTARYLAHGIPVIGREESNFPELFAKCPCGLAVGASTGIAAAIQRIEKNYAEYSRMARSAFEKYYTFEKNISGFEHFIGQTFPAGKAGGGAYARPRHNLPIQREDAPCRPQ